MRKTVEVLIYLFSFYTLLVFAQEVLISEFKVKLTLSLGFVTFDGFLLVCGGFVLGIALYLLKGRRNKIFATVMIIENVVSLFIGLKYLI
jgi:hypothetical protein